ncbi:hypothetical protein V6N12_005917 [Hibiscus sabdariffa]|uniref:S-acyltransferase n=1 Tax=Hibiscus sabdariffa TaxID=183260 RepID=A0ABR2EWG6_9ROSI
MRKHGWQLPYHPLQVVAVAVFLALGFAFYVFFAPFVGNGKFQYIVMGIYTPLIMCCFGLYIWCAAADPADPGVFKSKKYLKIPENEKYSSPKDSKLGGDSTTSLHGDTATSARGKTLEKDAAATNETSKEKDMRVETERNNASSKQSSCFLWIFFPCAFICKCCSSNEESSEQQTSEDGMYYCSLCEVELILLWSTGILVLICCFIDGKQFSADVSTKLGSSFSLIPFVIVVALCTVLAMVATLPIAQLFFFHVLLVKKGIGTYDYIVALREQEQEQQGIGGHQSPQMSPASSLTGLSSASSFSTFHRGAWCTPPRLFLEDQFDVVPPDTGSGEDVSKAAAEARKKSKILQPVVRREAPSGLEAGSSFGSSGWQVFSRDDSRRRASKHETNISAKASDKGFSDTSSSLAPLQLEARSAFQTSLAMSSYPGVVASSPESSLDSPDTHPFRVSSSGAEESRRSTGLSSVNMAASKGFPLSRSTSDGYEASGGEDSDRVSSRIIQRSTNWSNVLFDPEQDESLIELKHHHHPGPARLILEFCDQL